MSMITGTCLAVLAWCSPTVHVTSFGHEEAFAARGTSEVHAAASSVFTELIAAADVIIGETLMATGLGAVN
jgi:hypothetical protein